MTKTAKPPKLVVVVWEDISVLEATGGAWTENKKQEYKHFLVQQVGYLIADVPEGIHLSHAWNPDLIAPIEQIPRGAIKSIKFLRVK
jgi:hypothetical protein